ncbi:Cationic amino acid transporter 2 [Frankliniella fusca]|uniref:Cationic amino acid transporter 2 n=1 Tax=Frankliniella fusca TaxID=407009 RepID=A0AAE1LNT4_9NEOP|nr:Cationic amino acid transporter 2 [Frankliniella fusca]
MLTALQTTATSLWKATWRKKHLDDGPSELARVLGLLDLTALGVGSTMGLGVYVLAGTVSRTQAGPAVVISFLIAAIASVFAGLCYAEFAARVPKAGSAYVYAYVAVGEAIAFIIGWTLILEYAIGTASMSRAVSSYVDQLAGYRVSSFLNSTVHMDVPYMAEYADFFSLFIVATITLLLAFGVKESSIVNMVFTFVNLATVITAFVTSCIYADPHNWSLSLDEIPAQFRADAGTGGFMPFGFKGVIQGAATCFFGFVGFDCIATTSEETKNPRRNIPLAIVLSLIIICTAYCGVAASLTLMWPYYSQDQDAPFSFAFKELGLHAVSYVVTVGAVFALATNLLGCMFPLPRILYSMSTDGILFKFLGHVNARTHTPVISTLLAGALAGVMALLFDLSQLIEMLSIGTLLAYSIVALCVLVLRYTAYVEPAKTDKAVEDKQPAGGCLAVCRALGALVNWERASVPTAVSTGAAGILVTAFAALALALCVLLGDAGASLYVEPEPWTAPLLALGVPLIVVLVLLCLQPQASVQHLSFAVPCLPVIPALSVFLNFYLMVELRPETWVRFTVWMFLGLVVYFSYSVRHSGERPSNRAAALDLALPAPGTGAAPATDPAPPESPTTYKHAEGLTHL